MNEQTALQIAKEVASIYPKSFVRFPSSENSLKEYNPIPEDDQRRLSLLVREMALHGYVTKNGTNLLSRVINSEFDRLLFKEIEPTFAALKDKYLFVANVVMLDHYFKAVKKWFREIMNKIESDLAEMLCKDFDNYAQSRFYGKFVMRLKECCSSVIEEVRNSHSLNSSWAHYGIQCFDIDFCGLTIAKYLKTSDFMVWMNEYKNLTYAHVRRIISSIPDDVNEHDFAALAITCVKRESDLKEELVPQWFGLVSTLFNMFLEAYHERVQQKKLKTPVDLLTVPDEEFDPNTFEDLSIIYIRAGKEHDFAQDLRREIERKVRECLSGNIGRDLQLAEQRDPLKQFQVILAELPRYLDMVTSRFQFSLDSQSKPVIDILTSSMTYFKTKNVLGMISDQDTIQRIQGTGQLCAQALCGFDSTEIDLTGQMEIVSNFFVLLADQGNFISEISSALHRQIRVGHLPHLGRLVHFLQSNKVALRIPDSLNFLMGDIGRSTSLRMGFQNPSAFHRLPLGSRSLVLRERDEEENFENLLVPPGEVTGIHKAFEHHIEKGLHSKEYLSSLNCLSFLTIRTSLFSGKRGCIKIRLMVYQYSVLKLLQNDDQILVQHVYKTLIRPDIKSEDAMKVAAQLVNKVLLSLMQPHPLIKVYSSGAEISAQDRVMLNSDFVHDNDILCIEPAILIVHKPTVQVQQPPPQTKRSKFKVGIAKVIIKNRLRQGPVKEQKLFDLVVEKAKRNTVQVEDVQEAFHLMFEGNVITRCGNNNEYVRYLLED